MVGKQAEASSTSGVSSALRNTRGRPVRTFVAAMKSLMEAVARRAKSTVSCNICVRGFGWPKLRSYGEKMRPSSRPPTSVAQIICHWHTSHEAPHITWCGEVVPKTQMLCIPEPLKQRQWNWRSPRPPRHDSCARAWCAGSGPSGSYFFQAALCVRRILLGRNRRLGDRWRYRRAVAALQRLGLSRLCFTVSPHSQHMAE